MVFIVISVILIFAGLVFFLGAAVGLVRFPDFYTRMHAAGKGDTLSSLLVLLGFAVYRLHDFRSFEHDWVTLLVILKILAISVFVFLTSPTSTSTLMDAGWEDRVKPIIKPGRSNHLKDDSRRN